MRSADLAILTWKKWEAFDGDSIRPRAECFPHVLNDMLLGL